MGGHLRCVRDTHTRMLSDQPICSHSELSAASGAKHTRPTRRCPRYAHHQMYRGCKALFNFTIACPLRDVGLLFQQFQMNLHIMWIFSDSSEIHLPDCDATSLESERA